MEDRIRRKYLFGFILGVAQILHGLHSVSAAACTGLSAEVVCTCDDFGHCLQGTVEVDPWLQETLKTQMDVQLDTPFHLVQLLDAHNAYNTRVYGVLYGANDTCQWPPPYGTAPCVTIANQEFSLTDLLNMGIRGIELDNWFCEGEMRIAHLGTNIAMMCNANHVRFEEPVAEIGAWLDQNEGEIIRIYMNEKFDQGNDNAVNGPFERHLGDRVLTPADLQDSYGGEWPTLRTMKRDGKTVVIAQIATAGSDEFYLHQGKYIHPGFWLDKQRRFFTNYPSCGGKNDTNALRFYSDSTHYIFENELLDGPSRTGYVEDLTEFVKCRIQYPGADMITPQFLETAVYTWARGEPANPVTDATSCILLSGTDGRWYRPNDCNKEVNFACRHEVDVDDWVVSDTAGNYDTNTDACPAGYRFALPQNGYENQKLLDELDGRSTWLNVAPCYQTTCPLLIFHQWIPLLPTPRLSSGPPRCSSGLSSSSSLRCFS
ncbi:uncharacterized protein [Diadema antillarum]|uniref:uncharacterized protein n=1 Tax=Diadema antillarum TaxID=105358 RepID=UPI003A8C65D4